MLGLYRDKKDVVVCGILSGIAKHTGYDVSLIRVGYAIFSIMSAGVAIMMYAIACLFVKTEPLGYQQTFTVEKKPLQLNQHVVIGGILVIVGLSIAMRSLFAWLDFGLVISVVLVGFGFYLFKQNQKAV